MNFSLLSSEMLAAGLGTGLLILGLIAPKTENRRGFGYITAFGLLAVLVATFFQYGINQSTFHELWIVDDYSVFMKQVFIVAAILVVLSAVDFVETLPRFRGEFFALIVYALLGMMVMASANDLITIYVGLELMTITFFVLVAYQLGDGRSSEAGIKYLILGSVSSAVLLYGMSILYGLTGTTTIPEMLTKLTWSPILVVAIVMLIGGFGFKISLVPFHMWSPDIYEGAPTPITAFLAVASKAAGFAVMVRVFLLGLPLEGAVDWMLLISLLAGITMVIGNVVAIPQTNIKRMLAYSSVAQAGYMIAGLMSMDAPGVKGILFYSMIYVVANVGAFTVATLVRRALDTDTIADYAGLGQRQPLLASTLTICLLSLAGIPPLSGFVGKFYIFQAVMDKGILWPAFVGFVMSMISVYYYLNVALYMWRDDPKDDRPVPVPGPAKLVIVLSLVVTVVLGVYPGPLGELATMAAKSLF
ncbi:NADH-quinone oxidoreductase subunit N [Heliophilum fasciatum]|uniref:NADH-quinone oxidoreductase subunit N n=1 Tax=Heliophilum fasciatum TaxID=35700 RepID=A0A4R2RWV8_9FIRM|nr:NADH-quinone oxidoreductase subunit N [Heliophilum fasciatum]MCW2277959.1 NADH-quinone oxidoreductase subunit N [Heliophilum fasciatum]TCP64471.1 NADH dehydrogenase subunit N [Heliophilum fasciatum]